MEKINFMKLRNSVLKSSVLCLTSLSSLGVFADLKVSSEDINTSQLNNKVYGVGQTYLNLMDSTRQNAPDFGIKRVRLGVDSSYQRFGAGVEIGFDYHDESMGLKSNGLIIRKADLYGDLVSDMKADNSGYQLRSYLGRHRPDGADGIGPDAASTPNGYDFMDGFFLENKIGLGSTVLGLQLGAANNMAFYDFNQNNISASSIAVPNSPSRSMAYYAGFTTTTTLADNDEIRFRLFYAGGTNQTVQQLANGSYPGSQQIQAVADLMHIEGSLAYDRKWWGANIWFELDKAGKMKVPNPNAGAPLGGRYVYTTPTSTELAAASNQNVFNGNTYVYGIGAKSDSSRFLHSMIASQDALTLAGAVVFKQVDTNSVDKYHLSYYETTLGLGYQTKNKVFSLELNGAYIFANHKLFANSSGLKYNKNERKISFSHVDDGYDNNGTPVTHQSEITSQNASSGSKSKYGIYLLAAYSF